MTDIDRLVGHQRAEFDIATRWFFGNIALQVLISILGFLSALADHPGALYWLSGAALFASVIWFCSILRYLDVRARAEKIRRATLIMQGLGEDLSKPEISAIWESCQSTEAQAAARADKKYFASTATPGPERLAQMLEESMFWTRGLQRPSAKVSWFALAILVAIILSLIFFRVPTGTTENLMLMVRGLVVLLVGLVGGEILKAAWSYSRTAIELDRLLGRLDSAEARGYPSADLILILSDYNSVVEGSPLSIPFMYWMKKNKLSKDWQRRSMVS